MVEYLRRADGGRGATPRPNGVEALPQLRRKELDVRRYALASTSANQGMLSVYGALRSSDNAVTVLWVINKTYGDLTSTISVAIPEARRAPRRSFFTATQIWPQSWRSPTLPSLRRRRAARPAPHGNLSRTIDHCPRCAHRAIRTKASSARKPFIRVESGAFVGRFGDQEFELDPRRPGWLGRFGG